MANSRLTEALANADEAIASTRGIYPYTAAAHVFKADGTPLEEVVDDSQGDDDHTDDDTH